MKVRLVLISSVIFLGLLTGCQAPVSTNTAEQPKLPTPTIHPAFISASQTKQELSVKTDLFAEVTPAAVPTETPVTNSTPSPTITTTTPTSVSLEVTATLSSTISTDIISRATQTPTLTLTLTSTESAIVMTGIYTDTLNNDWRIKTAGNVTIDQEDTTYTHRGLNSIAITPVSNLARVIFYVRTGTTKNYLRDEILGLSFWLNSGDEPMAIDDLALGVIGSEKYPYWVSPDSSVKQELFDPIFTEEQEYLLGFNRTVPPNTWVEVEILLDELTYDTNYQYVTGFQLKNNVDFQRTFYLDDISLLLLPGEE